MVLAKATQCKRDTFSHAHIGEHTLIALKAVLTTYSRKQLDALASLMLSHDAASIIELAMYTALEL